MFFHESLPAALKIAAKNSLPLDRGTVVIRDAVGRLAFARQNYDHVAALTEPLKKELGGYAAAVPVITGQIACHLAKDPNAKIVDTNINDQQVVTITHIDRRLVGADWLLDPGRTPLQESPKRLVFASLKGGVGRSTALTVLAASLAQRGLSVLAIDLDMEAPGIGSMLLPSGSGDSASDRRPRFGVVDYLLEEGISGIDDDCLIEFISPSPFANTSIDVIPAVGRETDSRPQLMIQKLSRALVEDVVDNKVLPVWSQIEHMIKRFEARRAYDFVLIDARAGLSEITAAPLLALGAKILLFGTNQQQTFQGYSFLLSHLSYSTNFAGLTPDKDWRRRLSFVQAKAPPTSKRRKAFRDNLYYLCSEYLYEEEEEEGFSFGLDEIGPDVPHDALYVLNSDLYNDFDPLTEPEQLDPEAYNLVFGAFLTRMESILGLVEKK